MILRHFLAAAGGLTLSAAALAQPLDLPPPLPSKASASAPPAAPLPPEPPGTGLVRANEVHADKSGAIIEDDALADRPPVRAISPETRIEQRRRGNRIVELTVTPAGSTRSYTIVNRVGQRPLGIDELSAGLSTPRFIKFEF